MSPQKLKSLENPKFAAKNKKYLVQGVNSVKEAIEYAPQNIEQIVFDGSIEFDVHFPGGVPVEKISHAEFAKLDSAAQGIEAVMFDKPLAKIEPIDDAQIVICNNVRDPGNLGTIIRLCDAAGQIDLYLTADSMNPRNAKVIRSSAGSFFHINIFESPFDDAIAKLKGDGFSVVATDLKASQSLFDFERPPKIAWLFGNEAWGLKPEELAAADSAVFIPMLGKTESLNLASSVALALYSSAVKHA